MQSILVVDDDGEIVKLLRLRLEKLGFAITTAADGVQALDAARRDKPDLMLLDVMMPHKSGWDVLRDLKRDAATKGIKIIMVTAIGQITNEITARMYGADAHVDKPFEFDKLETVIRQVLATGPSST
jgi:DNA-binding response OmpR family regulator